MNTIKRLADYLKTRRNDIVESRSVLVEVYDPTYGLRDPTTETMDVVDFDKLCAAIDDFGEILAKEAHHETIDQT